MTLINLDSPPGGRDSYKWADFVELQTFINPDCCFAAGDMQSIQRRVTNSNRKFNAEERWDDAINFIKNRLHAFADFYPFELSSEGRVQLCDTLLNSKKQLYLALLISSSLRFLTRDEWPNIARMFEQVSLPVFTELMPRNSEIRATWASGGEDAPYTGSLYEKICAIALDIRCNPNVNEHDFSSHDSGDGGLDIIAWHPMADARDGIPVAFAQCSCSTEDWTHKQLEASPAKLRWQLPMRHPWATYYFLPLDLRCSNEDWAHKNDLGDAIFVDRLRIVKLVDEFEIFEKLPPLSFIDSYRGMNTI